jgi:hypothetical protein
MTTDTLQGPLLKLRDRPGVMAPAPGLGSRELVFELEATFAAGLPPDYAVGSSFEWANACHWLLEAGRVRLLEYAARHLHAAFPDIAYLATLVSWFDAIPRHLPEPLPFTDEAEAEIQIVRRAGCDTVLFCFCGARGTLGTHLNLSHEWLGRLPVTLVYIKDFGSHCGGGGYPTLASDRETSVMILRWIAGKLGGKRIFTLGVSLGGYPALHYGLRLGAEGVLSLAGATDLTREFNEAIRPLPPSHANLLENFPDYAMNMRELYGASGRRPRVLLAHSAGERHDRLHAERMSGLPGVDVIAVENHAHHNVVDPLMQRKQYGGLLHRLLSLRRMGR